MAVGLVTVSLIPFITPGFIPNWFGRIDLYGVSLVCAICIAILVRQLSTHKTARVILGATSLVFGLLVLISLSQSDSDRTLSNYATATLVLIASFLIGPALTGSLLRSSTADNTKPNVMITILTMIGILAIPFLYSDSVRRSTEEALAESLSSQRYYKSLQEAELLSTLAPSAKVLEIPVASLKTELAQQVTMLETSLSEGSSPSSPRSVAHAGQRVTALMQLDRYQEALKLLKEISSQEEAPPQVLDFSGLCCQRLSRWEESRDWYRQSRQFWATQPESPMQHQALISAYKGIAFAERQLEHPASAEQAYLSALKLEPNADIHFLLARLYDQQERTADARKHATQAMTLAPARYGQEGQSLLRRASLSHFGCSQFLSSLN